MDPLIKLWHDNLEYPDIASYFLKKIRERDFAEKNPMSFGQLDENHPPSPYPMSFGQSSPSPYTAWKPDAVYRGGKG